MMMDVIWRRLCSLLNIVLYVCVRDVMAVVFFACIVTRGAVGARVWEV